MSDPRLSLARRLGGHLFVPCNLFGGLLLAAALLGSEPWLAVLGVGLAVVGELTSLRPEPPPRRRIRQAGFTARNRGLVRALFVVAAVGAAADVEEYAGYLAGLLMVNVAAWYLRRAFERVLETEPPMPLRNLGEDLELRTFYLRARRRRTTAGAVVYALEFPLAVVLVVAVDGGLAPSTAALLFGATLVPALGLCALAWAWSRRFLRSGRVGAHVRDLTAAIAEYRPEVVAYFSGPPEVQYWINQWLPALNRLDRRVLILTREPANAARVGDTPWPIIIAKRTVDIEVGVPDSVDVALYFGNAGKNVHMLRYARIKHAFLNHGDSDKATSASPVARVYDRVFVAGEAGIDRYHAAGVEIPRERFALVGRPQLDGLTVGPRPVRDDRLSLLYAPTFEGFFDDINYSSLEVMGPAMIARLLAHPSRPRIIFKPHPFTGRVRGELRAAQAEVERLLRSAGDGHLLAADHPEVDLFDWFDEADVLVSDISSVVSDFLYTSRPYLLTNPRGLAHDRFCEMFPNHRGAYLVDPDLAGLDASMAAIDGEDPAAASRAEARRYLLGEHEHGPQASFDHAIDDLVGLARRDRDRIATTFTFT